MNELDSPQSDLPSSVWEDLVKSGIPEHIVEAMRKANIPRFIAEQTSTKLRGTRCPGQPRFFHQATQLKILDPKPGNRTLEVGTALGCTAAILNNLDLEVYSVEIEEDLHLKAKKILQDLGHDGIQLILGDGLQGSRTNAPFDRIFVTCALTEYPQELIDQLSLNGRILFPLIRETSQHLCIIEKQNLE